MPIQYHNIHLENSHRRRIDCNLRRSPTSNHCQGSARLGMRARSIIERVLTANMANSPCWRIGWWGEVVGRLVKYRYAHRRKDYPIWHDSGNPGEGVGLIWHRMKPTYCRRLVGGGLNKDYHDHFRFSRSIIVPQTDTVWALYPALTVWPVACPISL